MEPTPRAWTELQELLPPLSGKERQALSNSLKSRTVEHLPVLVMPDGRIVDGHHRWELSGGQTPVAVLEGISEDEALNLGVMLNVARRQLSLDQVAALQEKVTKDKELQRRLALALRAAGWTQEQAGAAVGVAQQTVSEWEEGGQSPSDEAANVPNTETGNGNNTDPGYVPAADSPPVAETPTAARGKRKGSRSKYDRRVVVPKEEYPVIYARYQAGETQAQIAADYKVERSRIAKIITQVKRTQKQREERLAHQAPAPVSSPILERLRVGDAAHLDLPDVFIDLIVTSPPYGLGKDYGGAETDDPATWPDRMRDWLAEMYRVAKPDGRLALNVPLDTSKDFRPTYALAVGKALEVGWVYRSSIIWAEGNVSSQTNYNIPTAPHLFAPVEMIAWFGKRQEWSQKGRRKGCSHDLTDEEWKQWKSGEWTFPGEGKPYDGHPAAFPLELPLRLIKILSYPGDVVLDPFLGSGTTALAALRLGRECWGFDLSPEWVNSARTRLFETWQVLQKAE